MPKRLTPRGEAAPGPAPNIAAAAIPKKAPEKSSVTVPRTKSGTRYVRNVRNIPVRVRLDTGRLIELARRGEVEDLQPITKEEQEDAKFLINIGHLFEVITAVQAREIIEKQATNAQVERPHHWAELLRGPTGNEYDPADIGIGVSPQSREIIVGQIEQTGDGRYSQDNSEVRRTSAPQQVSPPGSIGNPLPEVPSDISAEDVRDFIAWRDAMLAREAE